MRDGIGTAGIAMASLTAFSSPALPRLHSYANHPFSVRRIHHLSSARFSLQNVSPVRWRNQLTSSSETPDDKAFSTLETPNNTVLFPFRLLEQSQKVTTLASLGTASLFVTFPANAAYSFGDPITEETLPSLLITLISALVVMFGYFIVAPLGIYYYLYKRWFKRKMVEAIFQFLLVFLFFPGMLLLAPFINMRGAPQEGAKEPWDEIRPE